MSDGLSFEGELALRGQNQELRGRVAGLEARQLELLETVARISRETPYPDELKGWEAQRAAMLAQVGTLRSRVAELEQDKLANETSFAACQADRAALMASAISAEERVEEIERERDAYKKAKVENDERFMTERDEARAERDAAKRREAGTAVALEAAHKQMIECHAAMKNIASSIDCEFTMEPPLLVSPPGPLPDVTPPPPGVAYAFQWPSAWPVERCNGAVPDYPGRAKMRCDLIKGHEGHCRNDDRHDCSPECPAYEERTDPPPLRLGPHQLYEAVVAVLENLEDAVPPEDPDETSPETPNRRRRIPRSGPGHSRRKTTK